MSNNSKGIIILWIIGLLLVFSLGMFIKDYRMKDHVEYRYIYYTDEKVFDDNISLDESEDYVIDTTGEELYFYDTDSIVRIEVSPAPTAITFGNDVGTLSWEEGIMRFEGDAEESAKIFFDYFLVMYIEEYIENEVKMRMQIPKTFDMPLDKNIEYGTEENLEAVEEWDNLDITNSDGRLDSGETFIIYTKPEDIMYLFSCNIDGFKPTKFLEITGVDMSECYIDGRLRVVIDDEICWIRLEID